MIHVPMLRSCTKIFVNPDLCSVVEIDETRFKLSLERGGAWRSTEEHGFNTLQFQGRKHYIQLKYIFLLFGNDSLDLELRMQKPNNN